MSMPSFNFNDLVAIRSLCLQGMMLVKYGGHQIVLFMNINIGNDLVAIKSLFLRRLAL